MGSGTAGTALSRAATLRRCLTPPACPSARVLPGRSDSRKNLRLVERCCRTARVYREPSVFSTNSRPWGTPLASGTPERWQSASGTGAEGGVPRSERVWLAERSGAARAQWAPARRASVPDRTGRPMNAPDRRSVDDWVLQRAGDPGVDRTAGHQREHPYRTTPADSLGRTVQSRLVPAGQLSAFIARSSPSSVSGNIRSSSSSRVIFTDGVHSQRSSGSGLSHAWCG